ncbi:MAG: type III-A CRISPR-associated RAMP protein Csm5 [Deltaproteobacteria bacterium]|nr:type III-A CRISPR-associated RAMP protein Csm5 [Deltaproteobacteria bacterium]
MTENPQKDIRRFHLRTVTPVHIGTREGKITALEFLVHNGRVHLVDDELLGQLLLEKGLLSRFIETVKSGPVNLARFLQQQNLHLDQVVENISRQSIAKVPGELQDFRPFVRDGQGQVYLPGSAVKGVFRTAVLYRLLEDPRWKQRTEELVRTKTPCASPRREDTAYFSQNLLQRDALQNFKLPQHPDQRSGPHTDILRCLTVRDAYPADAAKTYVVPIDFLSKGKRKGFSFKQAPHGDKKLQVWVEAAFQSTFLLELSWDRALFEQFQRANRGPFPVNGLEDLLAAVAEMNRDLANHEVEFYTPSSPAEAASLKEAMQAKAQADDGLQAANFLKDWYGKSGQNLLRLGFGSGMLSTTVSLRLPLTLRQKVRDHCGHRREGDEAPKSRRVWHYGKGQYFPLGWVRLDKLDTGEAQR